MIPSVNDLGKRVDFHSHTLFSDGDLLPAALVREAELKGVSALGITDHIDYSNYEIVVPALVKFAKIQGPHLNIPVFAGAEISYITPDQIEDLAKKARTLGAQYIIVHGETVNEKVYPGTNHTAVQLKGLVDILAHPGNISEEDVNTAVQNNIYLELSARAGHNSGNEHVARTGKRLGAKFLVNTDAHSHTEFINQEQAFKIAKNAGLTDLEALKAVKDNPQELILRIGAKSI
jgi:histidinol phosphatase-like PHP family hydrolase